MLKSSDLHQSQFRGMVTAALHSHSSHCSSVPALLQPFQNSTTALCCHCRHRLMSRHIHLLLSHASLSLKAITDCTVKEIQALTVLILGCCLIS